ncbi:F-box protein At1g47056 [Lathyrus oleraceus]|uniref:F-box/LRR-repeat protein n=1 Tax=Pisum sativum TaxID=3888 RepID=A0A9D5A4A3_PEA|nr:F-box protein At1g47056-like [Pisum sativum]KAI5392480.1 hypothetical protein KIW84_077036 [Pisum sativum]
MAAAAASKSNLPNTMTAPKDSSSYLPDDLWECIFKFLNGGHHRTLQPLTTVSKQFLSITNRLRLSLTITYPAFRFLPNLFHRFPNLTSLDLTLLPHTINIDALLIQIAALPYDLRSLSCNNMPVNGLLALSKTMKNLTYFSCSRMPFINKNHLLFIAYCFPLLEELNLTYPVVSRVSDFVLEENQLLKFPKLRKINLSGNNHISDTFYHHMWECCVLLEEFIMSSWVAKKLPRVDMRW